MRVLQTPKFDVETVEVPARDGVTLTRHRIVHRGAVVVIPVHDDGRVVLIENQRWAIGETLLEACAGTLDPREAVDACARRELQEETGLRAERMEPLCRFFSAPGYCTEEMHVFVARGLSQGPQQLEADEHIVTVTLPLVEAVAEVGRGRIRDAKTMASLLYLVQFREGATGR